MRKTKHKAEPIILLALFVIYLVVLFRITIFRDSNSGVQSVNLVPFITISMYFQSVFSGNKIIGMSNLLGNLIMFLPLGYISAVLFPKMRRLTRILILAFVFSLVIEVIQYIFACGSTDIDDVILNTLGGTAGYWLYILTSRFFKPRKYAIFISTLMTAFICIGFFTVNNYRFLLARPAPGDFPARGNLPTRTETRNRDFGEPITIDEKPNAQLSVGVVTNNEFNTDFDTDSTSDPQGNADETAWCLVLVNKWNYLPDDYEVELTELTNGQLIDKRVYPALQEMFDAARSDGVYPIVASGYRTAKKQQSLMDEKIADYRAEGYSSEEAITKAEAWVAVPGTSEHQLGIAVDINADGIRSAGYEVYEWLNQNAYKFGFICRYPPDKTEITGVIGESWHYRYVGIEVATDIQNQGVCLEEYLNRTN